jgi:predicted nuclease of predicted toxin-antitoxin system
LNFQIDQNLPAEYAAVLRQAGYPSDTVDDEALGNAEDQVIAERVRREGCALVTLDLGFDDIRPYPPAGYSGLIVVRSKSQDKITLPSMLRRLLPVLRTRSPQGQLWIVESDRVRFREG